VPEDIARLAETASRQVSKLELDRLSDQELAGLQAAFERARRALDAHMVLLVRDILRRPRIGSTGSSARFGSRNVEALIRAKTGLAKERVAKYIAVSAALDTAAGAAVLDGTISVDAAYAIQPALPSSD
jgi:hypothetical protein